MPSLLKNSRIRSMKGFTLVELLVVIAIIGVLATLILLQLNLARGKARDAKRIADMAEIRSALELFLDANGNYPNSTDMQPLKNAGYIVQVPVDPLGIGTCNTSFTGVDLARANCYGYAWEVANKTHYQLWAELEYKSPAVDSDNDLDTRIATWGGAQVDGIADTVCDNATPRDCVYDLGEH